VIALQRTLRAVFLANRAGTEGVQTQLRPGLLLARAFLAQTLHRRPELETIVEDELLIPGSRTFKTTKADRKSAPY
jgi:hypothetical protein